MCVCVCVRETQTQRRTHCYHSDTTTTMIMEHGIPQVIAPTQKATAGVLDNYPAGNSPVKSWKERVYRLGGGRAGMLENEKVFSCSSYYGDRTDKHVSHISNKLPCLVFAIT